MCVNNREQWKGIMNLMELELGVLENYSELSIKIRASLHAKDWPALEFALRRLEFLADSLGKLEDRRQALSEKLGGRFIGKRAVELPDKLRRRFNYLKLELKTNLLKVRSRIRGIATYTESRGRLTRELVENLVPSARGRIYNERGQTASGSGDPLVVSHSL